jgi:hypothetical protein
MFLLMEYVICKIHYRLFLSLSQSLCIDVSIIEEVFISSSEITTVLQSKYAWVKSSFVMTDFTCSLPSKQFHPELYRILE